MPIKNETPFTNCINIANASCMHNGIFETSLTNNVSYELTNSTQVATTPTVLKSINGLQTNQNVNKPNKTPTVLKSINGILHLLLEL